mmetsp:Transcript_37829/g.88061  ORF Transcript_37829/g.88061 Transcript_37829/m.88061 type:complete len:91 (+) Transcript_37829:3-275(+)
MEPNAKDSRMYKNLEGLEQMLGNGALFLDGELPGENDLWFFRMVMLIHPTNLEAFPKVKSWSFRMFEASKKYAIGDSFESYWRQNYERAL